MVLENTIKYCLRCDECEKEIAVDSFKPWFWGGQACPQCKSQRASVYYPALEKALPQLIESRATAPGGMWGYFPFLPVLSEHNVVTGGEGIAKIERWPFLESIAESRYGVTCEVYAHRQDMNPSTGSFKDLAGSVLASVLKESTVKNYVVASTGNIGVAFSRYLASADINLYIFIPENTARFKEAEIGCFGQQVFRVMGNYSAAKSLAQRFAEDNGFVLSSGTFDPVRIEAKKTMAFEWQTVLKKPPTVYIQALSGGTGPLGVLKGCRELKQGGLLDIMPRLILVQTSGCSPMADAWQEAESKSFPDGWEQRFPVYENIPTRITTLATGNPEAYPVLAPAVRESGGAILSYPEPAISHIATVVAIESAVRIGPAAAVGVGGFLTALSKRKIRDKDTVVINIGEGVRREPDFMMEFGFFKREVQEISDCKVKPRPEIKKEIISDALNYIFAAIGAV
jgi:threonine synthase